MRLFLKLHREKRHTSKDERIQYRLRAKIEEIVSILSVAMILREENHRRYMSIYIQVLKIHF